ncbi:major facilitator superfamily domain-containing protein [Aspergillus spinulosporus]
MPRYQEQAKDDLQQAAEMESRNRFIEPPGTVTIEDLHHGQEVIVVLKPTPSEDPNDPLNWSKLRKLVNFALASFYTLATFVLLDIGTVIWVQLNAELGISWSNLNNSFAVNLAGLAIGCILIVPFAIKYGRRSIYILSSAVQLATAIWQAKMNTTAELLAINALNGLAGAVSEALVQMTIVDIFFVHQRASANAFYNFMVNMGAYLAPVAAGYCATAQGWRWIWCEHGHTDSKAQYEPPDAKSSGSTQTIGELATEAVAYPRKPYRERLALITKTENPIWENAKRPLVVLVSFPAVTFAAFVRGCFLSWFSIIATTQSSYLALPPYNYNSSQIGLFNLPPFIGGVIGGILSGPVNDWYVLWRAKRNSGVFEPESRLHMSLPAIIATPIGLLVFGIGLARIIGDALVGVAFVRNGLATVFVFALTPWIEASGLVNMFIAVTCIATAMTLTILPMIVFGKRLRVWTEVRYRRMAALQPGARRL